MTSARRTRVALGALLVATGLGLAVPPAPAQALVAPGPGSGPVGASARLDLDRHIRGLLASRLSNPRLGNDVAIQVRSADGTSVLFSSQSTAPQMPASNMKLVTAVGALTTLDPDRTFPTRVTLRAAGSGVVLVGGGDPLLSSSDLSALATRTVAALASQNGGVAPTSVALYVDDSFFRDGTLAPGWRSTYVPGEVTYVRSLGRHGVLVSDTAKDAGTYFAARLAARGVKATYAGRSGGSLGAELARFDGHSVASDVSVMLRDSDNQIAETLFRQVALASGRPATWAGGSAAAFSVLAAHGIRTTDLRLYDGSGLSRSDRLTVTTLAQLLTLVQGGTVPELDSLVGWLPVSGRTGTLAASKGRYTTSPSKCALGLVHAKTGTLTGAVALSGIAVGWDGRSRAFSIIVNHPPTDKYSVLTVRRAMDGLAATVTGCW